MTSPAAACGRERRAEVLHCVLRSHPREQGYRSGHQLAEPFEVVGPRGAGHRAHVREPGIAAASAPNLSTIRPGAPAVAGRPRPGSRPHRDWRCARARTRRRPRPRAAVTIGSSASRPSNGLAVTASAPSPGTVPHGAVGAEQRLGVRRRGVRHVAPLAVGDHEQAGSRAMGGHLRERLPARSAEPLEAGQLQLHPHAGTARRVDQRAGSVGPPRAAAGELRLGGAPPVARTGRGQQFGRIRIEPEQDLAARSPTASQPGRRSSGREPASSRMAGSRLGLAALDGLLERGACREARHLAALDRDSLAGARVDALAVAALGHVELAEAGEVDVAPDERFVIVPSTDSTASVASLLEDRVSATWSMNSCFVTFSPLSGGKSAGT